LSFTEAKVAELYCHGLIDKEVADKLEMPIWTIRTHKKRIYKKLGISSQQELILYMITRFLGVEFNLRAIRDYGLQAIFT